MKRVASFTFLVVALTACGDDEEEVPSNIEPESVYAGRCASPREGTDPTTGDEFIDVEGSLLKEKLWVRSWINDYYLWYGEVDQVDPKPFPTVVEYFDVMKTNARTASGKLKDEFHFTYVTSEWVALSQSGIEASYGAQWVLLASRPPRKLVVAYVEPGSPAATAGLDRGDEVSSVDGVDLVSSNDVDTLNGGLFPSGPGQTHTFTIFDYSAKTGRTITMTSASITSTPVPPIRTIATDTGVVGYLQFNDHIATAEKGLAEVITQLKNAGVTDLVLDMRYNGGGYLAIASELAYMIAGPERTAGKVFERTIFNDKYPDRNPITGGSLQGTAFLDKAIGFSLPRETALPTLGLPRVFVLTGSGTCSASEAVMNGLAGIDVEVIQIGATTCGKPYGFYPADNCGTTYFAIQFQGVNQKAFGDYADGFVPGSLLRGCNVPDDFGHALGDPAEARLAAALRFRTSQSCAITLLDGQAEPLAAAEGIVLKPRWRQNRIVLPGAP